MRKSKNSNGVWVLHEDVYNVDSGYLQCHSYTFVSEELAKKELARRVARKGSNPIPGTLMVNRYNTSARWFNQCCVYRLYVRYLCVYDHTIEEEKYGSEA